MEIIKSIKKKLNSRNDISLVFVHGIASTYGDWFKTAKTITDNRFFKMRYIDVHRISHDYFSGEESSVWSVSYYTKKILKESLFGELNEYSRRFEKMMNLISGLTGRNKVVIIAHSMGGLVARKYMTLSQENWDSTHKILTVGTPNEGVSASIGIVGQLADLRENSAFLTGLNKEWEDMCVTKKWGVIGALDKHLFFNRLLKKPDMIDSAGPGYVAISSSIPYGEWEDACMKMGEASYNTENFGFRLAVYANHRKLLNCEATYEGIDWALN